jgi:hypothetical protein
VITSHSAMTGRPPRVGKCGCWTLCTRSVRSGRNERGRSSRPAFTRRPHPTLSDASHSRTIHSRATERALPGRSGSTVSELTSASTTKVGVSERHAETPALDVPCDSPPNRASRLLLECERSGRDHADLPVRL